MINVGFIGCGYWGPKLIRNFADIPQARLHTFCDLDESRIRLLSQHYGGVNTTTDYRLLLEDPALEAVVIATPAVTHYSIARECLLAGKHVLVEKPLAMSSQECRDLIQVAEKMRRTLMVSHTFLYNAAVRKVKELISSGELGDILYIYTTRVNLGIIRGDLNAMWNFAPHDLSILLYLLERDPVRVSARGFTFLRHGLDDVVFMVLDFPGNVGAHLHISWLDPNKVRQVVVVGREKMIVYDDTSLDTKIKIYDKSVRKVGKGGHPFSSDLETFGDFQLQIRAGSVHIPALDFKEPLQVECQHFLDCLENGHNPLSDGLQGLRVVRILEACQMSLDREGAIVRLDEVPEQI